MISWDYHRIYDGIPSGWWFEPLWKIWLRQLGWWNSQSMEKNISHVPVTTNQIKIQLPWGAVNPMYKSPMPRRSELLPPPQLGVDVKGLETSSTWNNWMSHGDFLWWFFYGDSWWFLWWFIVISWDFMGFHDDLMGCHRIFHRDLVGFNGDLMGIDSTGIWFVPVWWILNSLIHWLIIMDN